MVEIKKILMLLVCLICVAGCGKLNDNIQEDLQQDTSKQEEKKYLTLTITTEKSDDTEELMGYRLVEFDLNSIVIENDTDNLFGDDAKNTLEEAYCEHMAEVDKRLGVTGTTCNKSYVKTINSFRSTIDRIADKNNMLAIYSSDEDLLGKDEYTVTYTFKNKDEVTIYNLDDDYTINLNDNIRVRESLNTNNAVFTDTGVEMAKYYKSNGSSVFSMFTDASSHNKCYPITVCIMKTIDRSYVDNFIKSKYWVVLKNYGVSQISNSEVTIEGVFFDFLEPSPNSNNLFSFDFYNSAALEDLVINYHMNLDNTIYEEKMLDEELCNKYDIKCDRW